MQVPRKLFTIQKENKMKKDPKLGKEIHEMLKSKGAETPMAANDTEAESKIDVIAVNFQIIMKVLGLDVNDGSLKDTPNRVGKMYVNELFHGLNYDNFPSCSDFSNEMNYDEMLIEKGISSMSVCEHHFATIDGRVKIGYIPNSRVIGLSKLNRVVDFFSRRPQVQERLTAQIFFALQYILQTESVAVCIDAVHYCVKCRGVKDSDCTTRTTKLGGSFMKPETRAEFLNF